MSIELHYLLLELLDLLDEKYQDSYDDINVLAMVVSIDLIAFVFEFPDNISYKLSNQFSYYIDRKFRHTKKDKNYWYNSKIADYMFSARINYELGIDNFNKWIINTFN